MRFWFVVSFQEKQEKSKALEVEIQKIAKGTREALRSLLREKGGVRDNSQGNPSAMEM